MKLRWQRLLKGTVVSEEHFLRYDEFVRVRKQSVRGAWEEMVTWGDLPIDALIELERRSGLSVRNEGLVLLESVVCGRAR